eukprot:10047755-Lingulodinium_polyedra.AAC.1
MPRALVRSAAARAGTAAVVLVLGGTFRNRAGGHHRAQRRRNIGAGAPSGRRAPGGIGASAAG